MSEASFILSDVAQAYTEANLKEGQRAHASSVYGTLTLQQETSTHTITCAASQPENAKRPRKSTHSGIKRRRPSFGRHLARKENVEGDESLPLVGPMFYVVFDPGTASRRIATKEGGKENRTTRVDGRF